MTAAATLSLSPEAIAFSKQSFRHSRVDELLASNATFKESHDLVRDGIVRNVKARPGGFQATSGVVLPYYLNLSTNFMDPRVAPHIVAMVAEMLLELHREAVVADGAGRAGEKMVVVGMEVAGGMLVSQLAARSHPALVDKFDFIYMRKERKTTGTAQQLEAARRYTERTAQSAPIRAIWVDDANSTGSSLTGGVDTLEKDYNIHVVAALYVVDRSADRAALPVEKLHYAAPRFTTGKTKVYSIFDLSEIDPLVAASIASS